MVRYTQDSWTNNAPNLQSNLWGDDPFPAVDSNWDQPGKSFVVSLNQTLGVEGGQHAAVLVFGEQDHRDARRDEPRVERPDQRADSVDLPEQRARVPGRGRSSGVLGRRRVLDALERGAVPQQPGPLRLQGRLLARVRQAHAQSRRSVQHEQEERGRWRFRFVRELGVLGIDRAGQRRVSAPATSSPTSC